MPPNLIGMTPNSLGLTIEDGEQLGVYIVELAVTDEFAKVTATQTARLEISAAP